MNNFSARAYLSDIYGMSLKVGGKQACPFCGHTTLSIAKSDQIAKCFHPTCGRFISPQSLDGERNPVQAFLWDLVSKFKQELLRQGESPDDFYSLGWQYLTAERGIHPQVIREALIGVVPRDLNLDAMVTPHQEKLEQMLGKKQLIKKRQERFAQALENFEAMLEKLETTLSPGNLAFFYTGSKMDILSIRFREPYTKRFSWFKPFPRSGVFNPQLDPNENIPTQPFVMLVEGEVNVLMLQSTLLHAGRPYESCIALGSSSAVDWPTLQSYKGKWILFQDHDEAGEYLAKEMQSRRTFWVTQAPMLDSDLDSFLHSYNAPLKALNALEELIKAAKPRYRFLQSIKAEILDARQNKLKLKEFEVNQRVSGLVIQELKDRGMFYKTRLAPYYFDNETRQLILIHKESPELLRLLHQLGLNPVETIHGYLLRELVNEAFLYGTATEVQDLFHYSPATNTLYWANGSRNIFKITSDKIEVIPNGTDRLLFLENAKYEPFQQVPFESDRDYLFDLLLSQVNFNDEAVLTVDEQRLVLKFYFLSLIFGSMMKTRPILCPVAEKGSGKTSLLRRVGQLLLGPGFDVTPLPEKQQDFQVALANNYFIGYDNVDERCKWLNDTLAVCATGGTIRLRTLYTTAEETEIQIRAFVALNSRTPNYRRDDVAERLLILNLKPWGEYKRSESDLNRELQDTRNAFLSWLLIELQQILKALAAVPAENFKTQFRVADFASFCYRIAKFQGTEESIKTLFQKLSTVQSHFTLENVGLYDCLCHVAEVWPGKWFGTTELHMALKVASETQGLPYSVKNAVSLGRILQQIKPNLSLFLDVQTRKERSNKNQYSFRSLSDKRELP